MLGPAAPSCVCPCAAGRLRGKDVASRRRLTDRGQPHDTDARIAGALDCRTLRKPQRTITRTATTIWKFALDAGMLSCHMREAEGGDR